MRIKLKQEWMGHQKGAIVNTMAQFAQELVGRGSAEYVDEEQKPKAKVLRRPVKDKMLNNEAIVDK